MCEAKDKGTESGERDYLRFAKQRIELKRNLCSGTNLSTLSGVPGRLPTMQCSSVATLPVGEKFLLKTRVKGEEKENGNLFTASSFFHHKDLMDSLSYSLLLSFLSNQCFILLVTEKAK